MASRGGLNRRGFLKGAGALGGVFGLGALLKYQTQLFLLGDAPVQAGKEDPSWSDSRVRSYRPLGRTGWKMSDISMGTSGLDDPEVVRRAVDRGINYIDTSPDYSNALSETSVGKGLQGSRDKVFLVSKLCTPAGHLDKDTPVPEIIEAVEASLRRLQTDYLDLAHIHACNSIDRLMAPTFHEAFDRLKEQGKVRFLGVSSHTPDLEKVMNEAVDSGRFDVLMVAYNFKNWPDLDNIIDKAHAAGVGFVAMKTLKGAYHTVLKDFGGDERNTFTQAAFKWVNNNPNVSGLVVTIDNFAKIDEYLYASGGKLDPADLTLLERYERAVARNYCRPGCGECLDSCPYDLPIDDILRYAMYYERYGQQRAGMEAYAKLPSERRADACLGCGAPCESSCPFEIPIRESLIGADAKLSLSS